MARWWEEEEWADSATGAPRRLQVEADLAMANAETYLPEGHGTEPPARRRRVNMNCRPKGVSRAGARLFTQSASVAG